MKIQWEFEACTDKTTLVNLTNHAFWNLDGLEPTIDDLEFQLNATTFFPPMRIIWHMGILIPYLISH